MKTAVYSGTRNLYEHMVPAIKSLIANSGVEKIFLLIEDTEFPEQLPRCVETVDVSGQKIFPADGPNMKNKFTYMAMLRAAYTKILPEVPERILQLDVDTIVEDDLTELWEMDLGDNYFAAVPEHRGSYRPYGPRYFNCGVMVIDIKAAAADGLDDRMIGFLNRERVPYIDQDAWNALAGDRGLELPVRYNECFATGLTNRPAIVHYAGADNWAEDPGILRGEYLRKWREKTWEEVLSKR